MFSKLIKLNSKNVKQLSALNRLLSTANESPLAYREDFATRHIGINAKQQEQMLNTLNLKVELLNFKKFYKKKNK